MFSLNDFRDDFDHWHSQAEKEYGEVAWFMENCSYYSTPFRSSMWEKNNRNATFEASQYYDGTAVKAANKFADSSIQLLMPRDKKWCKITAGPRLLGSIMAQVGEVSQDHRLQIDKALAPDTEKMIMLMSNSDLYMVARQCMLDFSGQGNSTMIIQRAEEDSASMLKIVNVPPKDIRWFGFGDGKVAGVFRSVMLTINQAAKMWPAGDFSVLNSPSEEEKRRNKKEFMEGFAFKPDGGCYYIVKVSEGGQKNEGRRLIYEEDRDDCPVVTCRWDVVPGQAYGFGVSALTYCDILSLQQSRKFDLIAQGFRAAPPLMSTMTEEFNSAFQLFPGALLRVDKDSGNSNDNPSLRPLEYASGAGAQMHKMDMEEMREDIRRAFHVRELSPEDMGRVQTATFWRIWEQEKIAGALGGYETVMHELLGGMARQVVNVCRQLGMIENAIKIDGQTFKIDYQNELVVNQSAGELKNLAAFEEALIRGMEIDPNLTLRFDTEELYRQYRRLIGVSPEIERDDVTVQELMAIRARQQQSQQQAMAA